MLKQASVHLFGSQLIVRDDTANVLAFWTPFHPPHPTPLNLGLISSLEFMQASTISGTSTRRPLLPPSQQVTPTGTPAKRQDVRPTPPRPTGAIPRATGGASSVSSSCQNPKQNVFGFLAIAVALFTVELDVTLSCISYRKMRNFTSSFVCTRFEECSSKVE